MSVTNLAEALKKAELTGAQERIDTWIKAVAQTSNINPEQVEEKLLETLSKAKPSKLSQENYLQYLFASTVGAIPTGENVDITPKGIFPAKIMKYGVLTCEMLARANIRNQPSDLLLIAKGEKNVQQLYTLDPAKTYRIRTGLKNIRQGAYKAWLNDGNTLIEEGTVPQNEVQCPVVHLSEAESNLSRHEPNSTIYVDRSDIRMVPSVKIIKITNGDRWVRLAIVDETFTSTPQQRLFPSWVNQVVLNRAGTGEGSFVNLLGTLELDDGGRPFMNVCSIIPIVKMPLQEPVNASETVRVLKISVE